MSGAGIAATTLPECWLHWRCPEEDMNDDGYKDTDVDDRLGVETEASCLRAQQLD